MLKATSETLNQRKTSLLNILIVGTTGITGRTLVELMMYKI
jgi:Flp pilus assembly CpaF family ATPase